MARFRCFDCKRDFSSPRGLSVHRARCKSTYSLPEPVKIAMAAALRKKRRNDPGPSESHRCRSVTVPQSIDSDADPSPSTIVGPPPAPDPRPEGSGGRSACIRTVPSQYKDSSAQLIPLAHTPQPAAHWQPEQPPDGATPPGLPLEADSTVFETDPNELGVDRVYPVKPSTDPDTIVDLEQVHESPNLIGTSHKPGDQPFHAPFSNPTLFRLMSWYYDGSTTYNIDTLITDVLRAPDFNLQDLADFSAERETKRFKAYQRSIAPDARFFDDEELKGIDGEDLGPEDGDDDENVDGDVVYNHKD